LYTVMYKSMSTISCQLTIFHHFDKNFMKYQCEKDLSHAVKIIFPFPSSASDPAKFLIINKQFLMCLHLQETPFSYLL